MPGIKIDIETLNLIPNILSASNANIEGAQTSINSAIASAPSDFNTGELKGVVNSIDGIISNVSGLQVWIKNITTRFETCQTDNANILNTLIGLGKGILNAAESFLDSALTFLTFAADNGTFVAGEYVPFEEGVKGVSEETWKDVMGFVANDYVESGYKTFYKETEAGQWLDENANDLFKSTGVVPEIASGLGEVVGLATVATLAGGTSVAALSATAGASGFGKYTEEYWGNAREAAKEGENWATEETRNKGILYGATNATWEAAQWYVGGKLNNLNMAGAPDWANSFVRVGIDTSFNAIDTPFRSLVDAITSDKTYEEAYEERGGKKAVITDIGVGLIGSLVGEIDNLKPRGAGDTKVELEGKPREYDNKPETHFKDTHQEGEVDIEELDGILGGQPREYDSKPETHFKDTHQEGEVDIEELDGIMGGQPRDYDNKPEIDIRDTPQEGKLDIEEVDGILGGQPKEYDNKPETNIRDVQGDGEIPTKDWEDLEDRGLSADDVDAIYEMRVDDRKDYGKFKMQDYFKRNSELGVSDEMLKDSFERIKVFESEEEFVKGYRQKLSTYGTDCADERIKQLGGIHWRDGEIFIRETSSVVDVIHEVVHDLGNVKIQGMNSRGFNEAFTERLARKIAGVDCNEILIGDEYMSNGYEYNVNCLDKIFRGLEFSGHTGVDTKCYFEKKNPSDFAELVNEIAGDEDFFKELVENMDIADGKGQIQDDDAIVKAMGKIDAMVLHLLDKVDPD